MVSSARTRSCISDSSEPWSWVWSSAGMAEPFEGRSCKLAQPAAGFNSASKHGLRATVRLTLSTDQTVGVPSDDRLASAAGVSGTAGEPDRRDGDDRIGAAGCLAAFPPYDGAWDWGLA